MAEERDFWPHMLSDILEQSIMRGPVVLIFVQTGCGACDEYMKRFDKIAGQRKNVPIQLGDLVTNPRAVQMANRYKITATPTTIGVRRDGNHVRLEGAVEDKHIRRMFDEVSK